MAAIIVREVGGVGKLVLDRARPVPVPSAHEVLVRNAFAGLNMHDTYCRTGLYPLPMDEGFVVGCEGGGVVAALGSAVAAAASVRVGDRVTYLQEGVHGTYAEYTPVPAARLMPVPDALSLKEATAVAVQGLTAHCECAPLCALVLSACPLLLLVAPCAACLTVVPADGLAPSWPVPATAVVPYLHACSLDSLLRANTNPLPSVLCASLPPSS